MQDEPVKKLDFRSPMNYDEFKRPNSMDLMMMI